MVSVLALLRDDYMTGLLASSVLKRLAIFTSAAVGGLASPNAAPTESPQSREAQLRPHDPNDL